MDLAAVRAMARVDPLLPAALLWGVMATVYAVCLGVVLLLAGRHVGRYWSFPRLYDLALLVGAFVGGWVVIPLAQWLLSLFGLAGAGSGSGSTLVPDSAVGLMALALFSVLAAITQELVYRGLLWDALVRTTSSRWLVLAGTSLVFGLLYLRLGVFDYLSLGVAWGAVAGGLYLASGRLTAVMLLNGLHVFLTYAVLFRYIV